MMRTAKRGYGETAIVTALVAFGLSSGCSGESPVPTKPGQIGGEPALCQETLVAIGFDEETALGFSPADVLSYAQGEHAGAFAYEGGGQVDLTVVIEAPSEAFYVEVEPSGGDNEIGCVDRVDLATTVSFSTGDGAFAESFELMLQAESATSATWSAAVPPAGISGTYDGNAIDPAQYTEIEVAFDGLLDETGTQGTVGELGTRSTGDDPDDSVIRERFEVGAYGQ